MRKKKEKNILMKIEEQLMERSRLRDTDTVKVRKKELGLQFLYKRKNPKANLGQVCGRIQGHRTGLHPANIQEVLEVSYPTLRI